MGYGTRSRSRGWKRDGEVQEPQFVETMFDYNLGEDDNDFRAEGDCD